MGKARKTTIADIDTARAVIAHEAFPCFRGTEGKESTQPKTLTSCTGGTFWGKPKEHWPRTTDGEPLIPWLQVVCAEPKGVTGAFYNRKAICFYIREGFSDVEATSTSDDGDFVVREYAAGDALVPLPRPKELKGHPFHRVTWEKVQDYPSLDKYDGLFDASVRDALEEKASFENRAGIKIGGWPTPLQGSQEYPGAHALQIETENFMYLDSGIAYLSREGERWYVRFESC